VGAQFWNGRGRFGEDGLQGVARALGFGSRTGLPLPNEASGRIPDPASRKKLHDANPKAFPNGKWFSGDNVNLAIGQGELVTTPLQLANAYAAFANGGNLLVPQLVIDAENPTTSHVDRTFPAKVTNRIPLQPDWRAAMIQGFTGVVNASDGTASGVFAHTPLAGMDIAGKTGTAQVNAPRQDTSVFTSFAPANNPQYVVDSFIEDAGYGASVAAPVVREIYDGLYNLLPQPVTYSPPTNGGQN
jgi:penicillin-binding protein 2